MNSQATMRQDGAMQRIDKGLCRKYKDIKFSGNKTSLNCLLLS